MGILDDGNSDRAVAVRRLADDCLGKPKPEIVGFGSSAGFDRDYCRIMGGPQPPYSRLPVACPEGLSSRWLLSLSQP